MQTEGLSKTEAIRTVEGFMAAVTEGLARDERVSLFGFGTFSLVSVHPEECNHLIYC